MKEIIRSLLLLASSRQQEVKTRRLDMAPIVEAALRRLVGMIDKYGAQRAVRSGLACRSLNSDRKRLAAGQEYVYPGAYRRDRPAGRRLVRRRDISIIHPIENISGYYELGRACETPYRRK